jgi:hypothetical protein
MSSFAHNTEDVLLTFAFSQERDTAYTFGLVGKLRY